MADNKNDKNESADLDAILSEINRNIKKEVSKAVKTPNKSKKETAKKGGTKTETTPRKNSQTVKDDRKKEDFLMTTINSTFVESARIIEDSMDDEQPTLSDRPVRFIAVTASEVVEDPIKPVLHEEKEKTADSLNINTFKAVAEERHEVKAPSPEVSREGNRHIQKARKVKKRRKMTRRKKMSAILGAVMTLFFVIGVISSSVIVVNLAKNSINQTAQKEELAREIFPFVIVDIPEFDNPTKINNSSIISSAIWNFIIDENDKSKYEKDEMEMIYVPAVDIEHYVRSLYGNNITVTHQSVDNSNVMMNYDADRKMYIIESSPRYLTYTPRVDEIKSVKDIYTLSVSYILPNAMWSLPDQQSKEQVSKTMQYVLKKDKDNYQVLSVKLLSINGMGSSEPTSSNAMELEGETLPLGSSEVSDEAINSQIEAAISGAPAAKVSSESSEKTSDTTSKTSTEE